jgi:putative addiction module component (TIGR02574 family)
MTSTRDALIEEATRLPAAERLELVDRILESLDETDPALDRLWAREAAERLASYRRGEITAVPLAQVLARYGRE